MAKRKTKNQIVAEVMEHNPEGLDIGVLDDYEPSAGELNNIVYLVCKYTANWPMRGADLSICLMMAGMDGEVKGPKGISNLVRVTCDYVWDHVCGEPSDTSPRKFFAHMKPMIEEWYSKTTPEDRAKTS